ncbi:hypothetical protein ILYODFUR_033913, partial [Ilyodon furcidens]
PLKVTTDTNRSEVSRSPGCPPSGEWREQWRDGRQMRSKFWRTEDLLAITLIFSSLHRFSIRFKLGLCLGLS